MQQELKTQETDWQAAPRFWAVGDYRMVPCPDGYHDAYYINCTDRDMFMEVNEALEHIEKEEWNDLEEGAKVEFKEIDCEDSALEWFRDHYDDGADLIPMRKEHYIRPDTIFLTKREAQEHIHWNHYHYTPEAHTYAMTTWRAPKVKRLLEILETMDWEKLIRLVEEDDDER